MSAPIQEEFVIATYVGNKVAANVHCEGSQDELIVDYFVTDSLNGRTHGKVKARVCASGPFDPFVRPADGQAQRTISSQLVVMRKTDSGLLTTLALEVFDADNGRKAVCPSGRFPEIEDLNVEIHDIDVSEKDRLFMKLAPSGMKRILQSTRCFKIEGDSVYRSGGIYLEEIGEALRASSS